MSDFPRIAYLLAPLLLGWLVQGLAMRFGWLAWLTVPIDAGRQLRGRPLFGPNKTWRGVVMLGLGTAAGFAVQAFVLHRVPALANLEYWDYARAVTVPVGFLVGAASMLAELPNSLLKRQLSIEPGAAGSGLIGTLFFLLDQVDILLGIWPVLACMMPLTAPRVLYSALFILLVHPLTTLVGYALGLRKTAR